MSYEVKVTPIDDTQEACSPLKPDLESSDDAYASGAEEVSTNRFIYSSCGADT